MLCGLCCAVFLIDIGESQWYFFFSSRRRHTRCALVTGVQTCALPILIHIARWRDQRAMTEAKEARHHDLDIGLQLTCRYVGSGEPGQTAAATAIAVDKGGQSLCDDRVATGFRENFERQPTVALDDRDARNGLDCFEHRLLSLPDRAENRVHLGP